jgi:hypothetical protein
MEFLEDFRSDDFHKYALTLSTTPPLFNYIKFNDYSILAYRYTIQNISELEESKDFLYYGLQSVPAISMWYFAVNSLINTILKISSIKTQYNYRQAYPLSLKDRYSLTLTLLNLRNEHTENEKLINKLNDFEMFYNYLTYDLFENEKLEFRSTSFSSHPGFINQVDVLQAFLISYELFEALRFVIFGLDLMPNISLQADNNKIVFEKLDVLKTKVLIPSIKDVLSKQKLKTKLNLTEKFTNLPISGEFVKKQVIPIFKYQQNDQFKATISSTKTNIVSNFHALLMKKYVGKEDKHGINFTTADF